MAENFLELSPRDRLDALGVAAEKTRRPLYLLEKDVWVVWALDTMFRSSFGEHLVFKGGTSLSKVYDVIRRFSEDVDLTYDMRALAPDLVGEGGEPHPASKSQEKKWSDELRKRLRAWVEGEARGLVTEAIGRAGLSASVESAGESLVVTYEPVSEAPAYVRPTILLEFGARSTGEPASIHGVSCDAAAALPELVFPSASPRVIHAERTFWEKATAMHVFALSGRFRGGSRFARHWYDLMKLDEAGLAEKALADTSLKRKVARHKADFFPEKDRVGQLIDYSAAVDGQLCLVPDSSALDELQRDYEDMVQAGLLLDDAVPFETLIERCRHIQDRANAIRVP